jgi:tryptophan-rich sensory protein
VSAAPRTLWRPLLVALAVAAAASIGGSTLTPLGPWYDALLKPTWQPPGWLFGPVWTTIYACVVAAAVIAWRRTRDRRDRVRLLAAFAVNFVFNLGWSLAFFTLQRPDWALVDVVLLWASIATLVALTWPYARAASLLLVPYLAWVSFAAFLNLTIVRLNAPFG